MRAVAHTKAAILCILLFPGQARRGNRHRNRSDGQKPNIVVILADDLGWNEVSWNNDRFSTPNLQVIPSCLCSVSAAKGRLEL